MKDSVAKFIKDQGIPLDNREADNYRPVPLGTYRHRTLPLGNSRHGITNGVVAHMVWTDGVCREVHMTNLECDLDPVPGKYVPKKQPTSASATAKPKSPRRTSSAQRVLDLFMANDEDLTPQLDNTTTP